MRVASTRRVIRNKWSRYAVGAVGAVLVVLLAIALVRLVNAAPVPNVSFTEVDETPMIGEQTTFTLRFDNSGDQVGFGPYVDLMLPEDFSNPSVSYLGQGLSATPVGPFAAGVETCFNHPLAKQSPTGAPVEVCLTPTVETTLYVIQLPFGSFTDTQTAADIEVRVDVADDASITDPQTVSVRGGFYLGNDALNNPSSDPSITAPFTTQEVQPTVLKLRKQYVSTITDDDTLAYMKNEYEIVPGENHYQRFRISANIADGAILEDIVLRDILPAPLKFIGIDTSGAHAIAPAGYTNQSNVGTNTAEISWVGPLTGTTSATDVQFDIIFEVPHKDDADAETWTRSVDNEATADATYEGAALPTITEPIRDGYGNEQQLHIKPMITQKTVSKVGTGPVTPSDTLEYTIRMYLSDYVAMNNMQVTDVLDDGLTYVPGSAQVTLPGQPAAGVTPTVTVAGNSEETLLFDLSGTTLIGGCVPSGGTGGGDPSCDDQNNGRTVVTVTFRVTIDEAYEADNSPVYQGHTLNNRVTTTADLLSPTDLSTPAGTATDESNAWVTIVNGSLLKSIYAVNGSTTIPSRLKPGDDVTYRLQYSLPNTDFGSLQLDDYLPLPMFTASHVTTFDAGIRGSIPGPGIATFGPNETLHDYTGNPTPSISHPGGNVVRFTWTGQEDDSNVSRTVDVLFTVTIGNQAYAPGMFITNQATSTENNVTSTATNTVIRSIEMEIPEPVVTKGVVASTAAGVPAPVYTPVVPIAFTDPGSAGTRFSGGPITDGSVINSDLANVDAGDLVTYAFVVDNTGKGDMYGAQLRDTLPANMAIPAGGLNLRVTNGTGTAFVEGTDFTNSPSGSELFNLTFSTAIPANDAPAGENLIVVTYDLEVVDTTQPRDTVVNTAQLTRFTADPTPGAIDYVVDQSQFEDDATITAKPPVIAKTITGSSLPNSETSDPNIVIGEQATYQITVGVPEGTLSNARVVDTLQSCLAVTRINSITASAGLSTSAHGGDWDAIRDNAAVSNVGGGVANDGRRVTFDFGTLTNSNTDNAVVETIVISLDAVAINATGCVQGQARNNAATLEWGDDTPRETIGATSPNLVIREPNVTVTKNIVPVTGDVNDVFPVTLRIRGDATGSRPPAYNVVVTDNLNDYGFTYVDGLAVSSGSPAPDTLTATGNIITAGWDRLPQSADVTITFNARLTSDNHAAGSTHSNTAQTTFTSYPGTPTGIATYNTLACERTGSASDCGQLNNYSRTSSDIYTISNVSNLTKSIVATSEAHTTGNNVTIGEIVRYRLTMRVPESTSNNVVVRDTLPAGLAYLGLPRIALIGNDGANTVTSSTIPGAFVSGNSANVTPTVDIPGGAVTITGQQVDIALGTLSNTDNDADDEYVVIEFNALVRNNAGNLRSSNINNQFTVRQNGSQAGSPSNTVTSVVQEPNVVITKAVTQAPVDAGDTVVYQITITNPTVANGLTGYDMIFTDTLDEHLQYSSVGSIVSPVPLTPAHTIVGGRDVVTIPISQLGQGQTVSFTITATVKNSAPASYVVPNTGEVTTTSLPGPSGTTTNPTGQSTPGATDAANGERRYDTSDDANTALGDPQITKTGPSEGATTTIGATVTYPITVRVPQGVTQNVIVTDNLPAGLAYVSHSSDISTLPSGSTIANPEANWRTQPTSAPGTNGQDLILNLGTVTVPGDTGQYATLTITVVARVLNVASNQNGTTLSNTATLRYTNPNTGNPSTITTPPVNVTIEEPRLALEKTLAGTGARNVGDVLSYTLEVENTGYATAHDWRIDDILPPHVSVTTAPTCTLEGAPIDIVQSVVGGTLTITPVTATEVQVGEIVRCTYNLTILSTAVIGSTYTNTADVDWYGAPSDVTDRRNYNDTPGNTMDQAQDTDTALFAMTGASFTKTVNRSTATIGDVATYTLTVNAPNGVVQDLQVVDVLPAGLTFVSTTGITGVSSVAPTVSGSGPATVTWDFGTINHNGDPITIEYQARVANVAASQSGVNLTNTAQVEFTPQGEAPVTEDDSATVEVIEPVLRVDKAVNDVSPNYGHELTYTLTVEHGAASNAHAYDAIISDVLPTGLTLVPGSVEGAGWSITESGNGFTATRAQFLQGTSSTITYRATVNASPPAPTGPLVNGVDLVWSSLPGNNPNERTGAGGVNDYATDDTVTVTAGVIDLAITKTDGGNTFMPGDTIEYAVQVQNLGSRVANDAIITEIVPAHTRFNAVQSSAGWVCTGSGAAGATCAYTLASVSIGANIPLTFAVDIDDYDTIPANVSSITNTITITGDSGDGTEVTTSNNSDDEESPLNVADIVVTKVDSDDPVMLGDDFDYTITVRNNGPAVATNVRINDELPEGVSYRAGTLQVVGAPAGSCDVVDNELTCLIASLAGNDETIVTLGVTGDTSGRKVNTVTARADQQDPNRGNNTDDEETAVGLVDISLVKTVDKKRVSVGKEVEFTLTVRNNGPDRARQVTITDTLPNGLRILGVTTSVGSCTVSGQTISCELGDMEVNDEITITYQTRVTRAGTFASTATAQTVNYEVTLVNNEDTAGVVATLLPPDSGIGRLVNGWSLLGVSVVVFGFIVALFYRRRTQ